MAVRKPEIQYVHQFYVYGSEAPAVKHEQKPRQARTVLPKRKRGEGLKIFVDPVALCGMVIAVAMAALLTLGVMQFNAARQEQQEIRQYLSDLKQSNIQLQQDYRKKYDLAAIEETARAIGLVSVDQLETISVRVTIPMPEPEPSMWDMFLLDLKELFA